jgi:hypothetical protein
MIFALPLNCEEWFLVILSLARRDSITRHTSLIRVIDPRPLFLLSHDKGAVQ